MAVLGPPCGLPAHKRRNEVQQQRAEEVAHRDFQGVAHRGPGHFSSCCSHSGVHTSCPPVLVRGEEARLQNKMQLYYDIGKTTSHQGEEGQTAPQKDREEAGVNILVMNSPTTTQSLEFLLTIFVFKVIVNETSHLNCQKNCEFTQVKAYTPSQNTIALGYRCCRDAALRGKRRAILEPSRSRARAQPEEFQAEGGCARRCRPPQAAAPPALHTAQTHCLQSSEGLSPLVLL